MTLPKLQLKETNIHNERDGNIKGVNKSVCYDPTDVPKITTKQTTMANDVLGQQK